VSVLTRRSSAATSSIPPADSTRSVAVDRSAPVARSARSIRRSTASNHSSIASRDGGSWTAPSQPGLSVVDVAALSSLSGVSSLRALLPYRTPPDSGATATAARGGRCSARSRSASLTLSEGRLRVSGPSLIASEPLADRSPSASTAGDRTIATGGSAGAASTANPSARRSSGSNRSVTPVSSQPASGTPARRGGRTGPSSWLSTRTRRGTALSLCTRHRTSDTPSSRSTVHARFIRRMLRNRI